MLYLNIFTRTFLALEAAIITAALGWDWATDFKVNVSKLAFLSIAPVIGAAGAALWAFRNSPAPTAIGKALRAAAEKLAGGLGIIVLNNWADVFQLPNLLVPILIATALSFVGTLFSYQGQPPVPDRS